MDDLIFKYPHTDLHSVNLDYILKIVRENAGLHLEVSGNQLLMKTADNTIISAITIPYATEAGSANTAVSAGYASQAGSAASATYAATAGTATTATNATNATHAASADTATTATTAGTATSADTATYATTAGSATTATSATNAAYAETTGNVEHALNAFEKVEADGNNLKFTKGDNTTSLIQAPFATKAQKDDLGNIIKSTYITNVVDNNGTLEFKNANGETVVSITPSVQVADQDSYGNTIADFIKTITQAAGSNYLTVSTGTGATDTITINYANTAWKDTNGNVIKNTYIKRLEIITDPNDGHKKLVAYNGDDPEAELFRFEIEAYSAQVANEATHAASADYATSAGTAATADKASNGDVITEYAKNFISGSSTYGTQHLIIQDGEGNIVKNIDLFEDSKVLWEFVDLDPTQPLNPFDSAFALNQVVEYEVANLADTGHSTAAPIPNILIGYRDPNNVMTSQIPIRYVNGFMIMSGYDYQHDIMKAFRIQLGTQDNRIKLTRIL